MRSLNRLAVLTGLLLTAAIAAAEPPVVRLGPAVRSSAAPQAGAGPQDVFVYPAGCFDAEGRPLNPDAAHPQRSADPACQPPSGIVVQGQRVPMAPGTPSMEPASISRPPLPVPVPDVGVMR